MYTSAGTDNIFSIKAMHTAFEETFTQTYSFSGEFHNFWEIVLVLDGKLGITAGSRVHILKKGQAVIHPPMEFHSLWSEGGTSPTVVIFSFSADNMPALSSKINEFDNLCKPLEILSMMKDSFVMQHGTNFTGIKNHSDIAHQLAIKELECFILYLINNRTSANHVLQTQTARNFSKAVNILEKNIDKNLSVKDIAVLCNMGVVSLKKIFSKYAGMGIMSYFTNMKITSAIKMLKSGMNVCETANALGFSNQNYFSTVFKRVTGYPPSHYK